MAVLVMTSDVDAVSLTMRGPVGRSGVDQLRAALERIGSVRQVVDLDLREVTEFSRLGIAVLVAARRSYGERLRVRANEAVVALLDEAGLTRVLSPSV
jgi:ABC-type transporter Mla MlaB component